MTIRSLPTRRPVPIRMEATLPAHSVAVSVALRPACTRCPIGPSRGTPLVESLGCVVANRVLLAGPRGPVSSGVTPQSRRIGSAIAISAG